MILDVLKKSFLISLIFLLIVIGLIVFVGFIDEDIFNGIFVIYSASFISIFCGTYFSRTTIWIPLGILTTVITTFSLVRLFDVLVYNSLYFDGKNLNHQINSLVFVCVFLSILSYLIGFFSKSRKTINVKKLQYNFLQSFIFCLSIIIVYSIIFGFGFNGSFLENLFFFLRILLLPAIILYIISIFLFNYIYRDYETKKWIIVVLYVAVFLYYFLSCYLNYSRLSGAMNIQNFLTYLLARVPFAFMIILCVQISYLTEINKQEKNTLKQQSLESQLNYQQLKNQLSPHFLFNNINVLTSLIEENQKKAIVFSENLSHIYRYFLEQEKQDVVLVKDEIAFAKAYLALLKDRFEIGLSFSINIDEDVKGKYIVSTILQQVLENVVKHNEINENNPVEVTILSEGNFIIIKNNKNPKLLTPNNSNKGIKNIKRRLAFFTDEKVVIINSEKLYSIKLPILEIIS